MSPWETLPVDVLPRPLQPLAGRPRHARQRPGLASCAPVVRPVQPLSDVVDARTIPDSGAFRSLLAKVVRCRPTDRRIGRFLWKRLRKRQRALRLPPCRTARRLRPRCLPPILSPARPLHRATPWRFDDLRPASTRFRGVLGGRSRRSLRSNQATAGRLGNCALTPSRKLHGSTPWRFDHLRLTASESQRLLLAGPSLRRHGGRHTTLDEPAGLGGLVGRFHAVAEPRRRWRGLQRVGLTSGESLILPNRPPLRCRLPGRRLRRLWSGLPSLRARHRGPAAGFTLRLGRGHLSRR